MDAKPAAEQPPPAPPAGPPQDADLGVLRAAAGGYPHAPFPPYTALLNLFEAAPRLLARLTEAEAEVLRLRAQVEGHAARIAAQAELLARRAEKGAAP